MPVRLLATAGGHYSCGFHHQDYSALRGPWTMHNAFGNDKSLAWCKIDSPVFEIDEKPALNYIEELIFFVVLVPVVFAVDYPQPNHRLDYLAQRLVVPGKLAGI